MKVVKVIGGLGNQMFQFCFFLYLRNFDEDIRIDLTEYFSYDLHNGFELDNTFNLGEYMSIASSSEIIKWKDKRYFFSLRKYLGRIFFCDVNKLVKSTHFVEPVYCKYIDNIHHVNKNYFEGYWQNERYLSANETLIRKLFSWKDIDEKNKSMSIRLQSHNSVSIHVRRYDKIHKFSQLFYKLRLLILYRNTSVKYYKKAIMYMEQIVENPVFYIFSNDMKWVRSNFRLKKNMEIIDWNKGTESNKDLFLMMHCKHNIISVSTFSWWGAWLNQSPSKVIVTPRKWALRFNSCNDILPERWIKI